MIPPEELSYKKKKIAPLRMSGLVSQYTLIEQRMTLEIILSIAYFVSKCISLASESREMMFKSIASGSATRIEG